MGHIAPGKESHMSRFYAWSLNIAYFTLVVALSPWLAWSAIRHGKYREGFAEKLWGRVPRRDGKRPRAWLHAVSVGEVNLLATTIAELSQRLPEWEIVVSTTTKTGYDLACRKYPSRTVFYCPLDFSWAVDRAMRRMRPTLLVLAELELWPNLIAAAQRRGVRVAIINGRLSDRSFRGYRWLKPLVSRVLRRIDLIAAQNAETAERFRRLGARPDAVHATGSLKFDGAQTNRDNPRTQELRVLAGLAEDDVVFLAGSTQSPEEQTALTIFQQLAPDHPKLRLVVVPRHPQRFDEVADLIAQSGVPWVRRSELPQDATDRHAPPRERWQVLLVDTIGELGAWWGAATVGFVGGSFGGRGGQNMIEPAAYGVATSFGPNTWNFRDIVAQLLAADAAVVVQTAAELEGFVRRSLERPEWGRALGERAQQLVISQQGATKRTADLIEALVVVPIPAVPRRAA
jgi:3-deoxy-D-manno-octulosonic-acid transferase